MLIKSKLQQSPFALLGATTRDDRRCIVELAEEKSLELDHDACQKARSDLTNPRNRLSAEMAWLPGISPRKALQLMSMLHSAPMSIRQESGVPTLAHLNLAAAAFEAVGSNDSAEDISEFIQEMAELVDDLSADQILRDINEDRSISGFPEVKLEQIEAELLELKRYYRNAIKDALNRLSPEKLVEVMTLAVDEITCEGELLAPELIDDLVDSYAVETQGFLHDEANNVQKLIEAASDSAKFGESAVKPLIDKIEVVARNWDKVAQPIQLSFKARGIEHGASREVAYSIRDFAIDLFNEHDMLAQSQRLTGLIQELFAELPEVVDKVEQDSEALENIFQSRKKAVTHEKGRASLSKLIEIARASQKQKEWAQDITYRAEVGVIFKSILSISPDGVSWKDQSFPLAAITRVRWGAVSHSTNGIPTGTTYTLAFGDNRSEAVVELKKKSTYTSFLDKLWRAVVIRLLTELLETLKSGKEVRFGQTTVRDDGITLTKHNFLRANEAIRYQWGQVHVWAADGAFYIGAKDDKKTYADFSYINGVNTHILEQAVRMAFKKPSVQRLSDVLQ